MPKFFAFPLLLLLLCSPSIHAQQAEWELLSGSPRATGRLDDMAFIGADTGWVIDSGGIIYKTTDGGESWSRLIHDETNFGYRVLFRSIAFANESVGWVGNLGSSSASPNYLKILHETRDGGLTWTDITSRITGRRPAGLCGMWVVSENLVFGVGRYGLGPSTLLKTTDGGRTWISKDMTDIAGVLIDVYFFDEQRGLIIGSTAPADGALDAWGDLDTVNAAVFMTSDGGETWTIVHRTNRLHSWGWKISFPTPSTGYVSVQGKNGSMVLKTTDGGYTWFETTLADGVGGSAIGFITEDFGWIGGNATARSTDGGVTWENAGWGRMLNRIRVLGDTLAFASGDRVYRYRRDVSTSVDGDAAPYTILLEQNYPNPFNPETTISYTVGVHGHVEVIVQDALGRYVTTLVNRSHSPGPYEIVWNGEDDSGIAVPSGLYFYQLRMASHTDARPMVLLR